MKALQEQLNGAKADDAPAVVDAVLAATVEVGASDLHLLPTPDGLEVKWRVDGVLRVAATAPPAVASNVIVRLKVLAGLLTYQTQTPQEGRLSAGRLLVEVRVSTFPTVHGEKAVARLFDRGPASQARLDSLGLAPEVLATLRGALRQRSGAVVIVGPAGSGKTTTAYACLREIAAESAGERSLVSLEDPVEIVVPGVSQSEASPAAGFDLATGLRSLLRQDPEVVLVGEVRDQETAAVAMQAAMTGQLVLTTFHAPDAATAVERLLDMGVPRYTLRAGVRVVMAQRLIRTLCDCAEPDANANLAEAFGAEGDSPPPSRDAARRAVGCERCGGSGYRGRRLLAALSAAGEAGIDAIAPQDRADLAEQARQMVLRGKTSLAETLRVFGGPT